MKIPQGISNDRGYVKIRVWLGPSRIGNVKTKPYTRIRGCWCSEHIKQAEEFIRKMRENFKNGKELTKEPQAITVAQAVQIYLDRHFRSNAERSKRSIDTATSICNSFIRTWPETPLHKLKPTQIDEYLAGLTIKDSAKLNRLAFLKSLFARMDEWNKRGEIGPYILPEFNPAQFAKKIKNAKQPRERYATREELKKMKTWALANDPDLWTIIEWAIITGLRYGDLKRAHGQRKIDIIQEKTERRIKLPIDLSKPVKWANLPNRWERIRKECDIKDFHFHDLRHTHATMLKTLGAATELIQETLGHSDIAQTEEYIGGKMERISLWTDKLAKELEAI